MLILTAAAGKYQVLGAAQTADAILVIVSVSVPVIVVFDGGKIFPHVAAGVHSQMAVLGISHRE